MSQQVFGVDIFSLLFAKMLFKTCWDTCYAITLIYLFTSRFQFEFSELFIDEVITHMRIELEQECDYVREAECARLMRKFLRGYPDYYVPRVIDDLSGSQVFTQEFIHGLTIDECSNLDQDTRDNIVKSFLVLLFTELLQFRYMQTDPNWANFLYNPDTKQVQLINRVSQQVLDKAKNIVRPRNAKNR